MWSRHPAFLIPQKFFGVVNPRIQVPSNNIILVGVFVLAGAFLLTYSLRAQLLNFGALIAFMGVNASTFVRYFLHYFMKPHLKIIIIIPALIC